MKDPRLGKVGSRIISGAGLAEERSLSHDFAAAYDDPFERDVIFTSCTAHLNVIEQYWAYAHKCLTSRRWYLRKVA